MIDEKHYSVRITFLTPLLGTAPKEENVYASYIASKQPDPDIVNEELSTLPDVGDLEARGWTGFHTDEKGPFLYDYTIKGFLKEAARHLRRTPDSLWKKVSAYVQRIDGLVFIEPRRIHLQLPEGSKIGVIERPLRAQTPQGERVALARSDVAPEGTIIEFDIILLDESLYEPILEALAYGRYHGLGQWRNGGYGRFTFTIVDATVDATAK